MEILSTYAHIHATVQLAPGERFRVTQHYGYGDKREVEVFEVRRAAGNLYGSGRWCTKAGSVGRRIATQVPLAADDVPEVVRYTLAREALQVAREAVERIAPEVALYKVRGF